MSSYLTTLLYFLDNNPNASRFPSKCMQTILGKQNFPCSYKSYRHHLMLIWPIHCFTVHVSLILLSAQSCFPQVYLLTPKILLNEILNFNLPPYSILYVTWFFNFIPFYSPLYAQQLASAWHKIDTQQILEWMNEWMRSAQKVVISFHIWITITDWRQPIPFVLFYILPLPSYNNTDFSCIYVIMVSIYLKEINDCIVLCFKLECLHYFKTFYNLTSTLFTNKILFLAPNSLTDPWRHYAYLNLHGFVFNVPLNWKVSPWPN